MLLYVVLILFGLAAELDGYVVLQLRRQANQSDVDVNALIHKRVNRNARDTRDAAVEADNKVIALGLDTGVAGGTKNGIVQAISDAFSDLTMPPLLRAHGKRPKHSDDKDKKPLAMELNSESILKGLEQLLSSPKIKKLTHDLARKAAIIYRAVEKEL